MIVYLPPDDPIVAGLSWGSVPALLKLEHVAHRANVMGGPMSGESKATGPTPALWECLDWLRRPVQIYTREGHRVWWGFVNEVRLSLGGLTIGLSLDPMFNRVAVAYSYKNADGSDVRGTTIWAEDAESIGRYGYKELLQSGGSLDEAGAIATAATILETRAKPRGVPSFGSGEVGAELLFAGWFETLAWRRFTLLEGRIEFTDNSSASQTIGWGLTSTTIGFATHAIHSLGAKLGALQTGDKLIVTGSASNNGTFTIDGAASGEQVIYTATTISFDPSDDINDSDSGFGFVDTDSFILVSGSAAHSGYHLIDEASSGHLATDETLTGTITTEAAGPSITVTAGHKVGVPETITAEIPGASVTLKLQGVQVAQSFVPAADMTVAQIAIQVGRIGTPGDNFVINLRANSAGSPGTVLESVSVTGASLAEDSQPWRWFTFSNTTALTAGTTYWISVNRSSSLDADAYYAVGMTEAVSGTCKAWTGSAWVAHPLSFYMPYKVWAAEENATQMARIIADCGQFLEGVDIATTGIATNQWRSGDLSGYDELMKLLGMGNSLGQRLLAEVTPERILRIYVEPDPTSEGDRLLDNSQLRSAAGGRRLSGLLPVGEWITVDSIPPNINAALEISPIFVDEAGWRSSDPDTFEIIPKAALEDTTVSGSAADELKPFITG